MIRIHNVKGPLGQKHYSKLISQHLNIREKELISYKIVKRSIDARRQKVHYLYTFDIEVNNENAFLKRHSSYKKVEDYTYQFLPKTDDHVTIIGSGPAGLFCAYTLASVHQKVTLIERGAPIEERVKDIEDLFQNGILKPNSNIAFGEGGAGTFSDGKLTTGIKNERLQFILETLVKFGAPEEILYDAKPHIGTDRLRDVLIQMREDLTNKGVTFLFHTQLVDLLPGTPIQLTLKNQEKTYEYNCDQLVLAIGHSARDTYEMLYQRGLAMEQKSFAVGVRIEQSQKIINEIQYKGDALSPHLKAAPYKLAVKTSSGRGVYTFCMCPGGQVVPSMNEEGTLCVNGMSYYDRGLPNANSAILVNITTDDFKNDHPLSGIEFQREIERKTYELGQSKNYAPVQKVVDYINNQATTELGDITPSYEPGYVLTDINPIFPDFINEALKEGLQIMNERMPRFYDENSILTASEARSSAPVRLTRQENFQSNYQYIYPIGEGAGYAGGIMSAALDGILCAEKILRGY